MPKREYDPLSVIPSAATLRQRLRAVQEQARRLRILLRTAEHIEQDAQRTDETDETGQRPQGVAHE